MKAEEGWRQQLDFFTWRYHLCIKQLKKGFNILYILGPHWQNKMQKKTKERMSSGKSIIDMCWVPAACCATEYPDCSLLYSYPSEGWQVIGGNGADEEDTVHRCWHSCSAEEMRGLTASARRAQTVWEGYWGASCRASSSTWLIWRSQQRSTLPEWGKELERNVELWKK